MVHQGYLEPQAAVADVDALGRVTVWTSTQALFFARGEVAEALGLPEHRVRVVTMPVGGASAASTCSWSRSPRRWRGGCAVRCPWC